MTETLDRRRSGKSTQIRLSPFIVPLYLLSPFIQAAPLYSRLSPFIPSLLSFRILSFRRLWAWRRGQSGRSLSRIRYLRIANLGRRIGNGETLGRRRSGKSTQIRLSPFLGVRGLGGALRL